MSQRYYDHEDQCEVLENSIKDASANVEPITPICNGESGIIPLSPLCDHYNNHMRIDSRLTTCSDEEILESLYENVFSLALCLQIEESNNGSHTPCPGAPMKLTKLSRNIDPGFQRKLF